MELDLDLSLSPYTNSSKSRFDFDLNKHCGIEGVGSCLDTKKLRFETTFGFGTKQHLCSLNDQPNEEDEEDPLESHHSSIVYNEEENIEVVGWPPIKSCMIKYQSYHHHHRHNRYHYRYPYHHHHGRRITLNNNISNPMVGSSSLSSSSSSSASTSLRSSSSMYVKVKMDGVAITRKVDLKRFNSCESLTNSLITMFSQYEGCDKEVTNYTFTFQGKDGERLIPRDIPWKVFVESVHRISISDGSCAYNTRCLF